MQLIHKKNRRQMILTHHRVEERAEHNSVMGKLKIIFRRTRFNEYTLFASNNDSSRETAMKWNDELQDQMNNNKTGIRRLPFNKTRKKYHNLEHTDLMQQRK